MFTLLSRSFLFCSSLTRATENILKALIESSDLILFPLYPRPSLYFSSRYSSELSLYLFAFLKPREKEPRTVERKGSPGFLKNTWTLFPLVRSLNCLYQSRGKVLILFFSRFGNVSITFSGILEVGGNDGQWCKLLLSAPTQHRLYHRCVVSSATLKHKWTRRLEKQFKVQEQ